jgi:regulatory protein
VSTPVPKPENRELVSAALRLLARRDMSRAEFIAKLGKGNKSGNKSDSKGGGKGGSWGGDSGRKADGNESGYERIEVGNNLADESVAVEKSGGGGYSDDDIAAVTEWCAQEGFLNETRFAEGNARRLGAKYGARRVGATLKQKGVSEELVAETVSQLADSDFERARALWLRKFGEPATNSNDKNKQIRFLQSRGFGFDVIKRVISGAESVE